MADAKTERKIMEVSDDDMSLIWDLIKTRLPRLSANVKEYLQHEGSKYKETKKDADLIRMALRDKIGKGASDMLPDWFLEKYMWGLKSLS